MIGKTQDGLNDVHMNSGYGNKSEDGDSEKLNGITKEHLVYKGETDPKSSITNSTTFKSFTSETKSVSDSFKIKSDELAKIREGSVLYHQDRMLENRFSKFARYGFLDPANENTGSVEYLFFSKPDLHLFNTGGSSLNPEISRIGFFKEAFNHYRYSMHNLQQYYGGSGVPTGPGMVSSIINLKSRFMNILSNQVSSTLDLPSITASEITNNQNLYMINTSYREGSEISDCAYDFSLEFKDTRYLDVYMLFKIYDEYIRYKYKTEITPNRDEYIVGKINPELFSIWKIIVDETNTVQYWAKATGVAPMSVPRDTMSNFEGNSIKFTINFKAQFIRDMDPTSLAELNHLTAQSMGIYSDSTLKSTWRNYAKKTSLSTSNNVRIGANTEWGNFPYIVYDNKGTSRHGEYLTSGNTTNKFYRLVWL